jgi:putative redox protein
MKNPSSKTILSKDSFKAKNYSRGHEMYMDRPFNEEGQDTAATPIEYLLAAIGGCVSMTLRVFANKMDWDLGEITVNVNQKNKLTSVGLVTTLKEEISFEKEISEEQREKLLVAASECPVVKLLKKETIIESIIV